MTLIMTSLWIKKGHSPFFQINLLSTRKLAIICWCSMNSIILINIFLPQVLCSSLEKMIAWIRSGIFKSLWIRFVFRVSQIDKLLLRLLKLFKEYSILRMLGSQSGVKEILFRLQMKLMKTIMKIWFIVGICWHYVVVHVVTVKIRWWET